MNAIFFIGAAAVAEHVIPQIRLPRCRYTRRGGLRFLRIGRFQFAFCKCKESI